MGFEITGDFMNLSLTGLNALVCGASQGIGRATAVELSNMGAQVCALARSEDKLQKLMGDLSGEGHSYLALDVSDRDRLKVQVEQEIQKRSGIHILICNSGGPKGGPLVSAEESEFLKAFENHILVNSLLAKLVFKGMKQKEYGRIINIISTSVKAPIPNLGVSNSIRGAVANWAKTLSFEFAPFNITVNNVLPGFTETPRLSNLWISAADKQKRSLDDVTAEWKNKVPLKRFARAEEVAEAIGFLASPSASYINGINLPVDGGRTASL